jgi:uncharacterized protein YbaR (Trm112 family)
LARNFYQGETFLMEKDPKPPNAQQKGPKVNPKLLEVLVCPVTHGPLQYDEQAQELISKKAGLAFPIREGIPIMLAEEARPLETGTQE